MSQWGAYQAALTGVGWEAIISRYYPGTTRANADAGIVRVLLEGDTGSDLIVRPETGLRVSWTTEGGQMQDQAAPTSLECAPRWWRVLSTGDDLAIEYLCDSWLTWQSTSAVSGGNPVTFRTDDGTIDTAIRRSSGFDRKGYRGSLQGRSASGTVQVINIVAVEDYLRSVVPSEMPPSWPADALRAQAVAARTYALRERNDRSGTAFHVYDSTKSQVYRGQVLYDDQWNAITSYEDLRSDGAVGVTRGRFLTYDGIPAFTQFSSTNGGYTAKGNQPYLPLQPDEWDAAATANPYREWSSAVPASSIEGRYPSIGTLQRIRVTARDGGGDWGGRVTSMVLEGSAGSVTVSGDSDVRSALGVRSSYFAFW
jgi:SpoIID/LytB domain protein